VKGPYVTLPNAVTAARGLAAVPISLAILNGWWIAAIALVFVAGVSDGLDGMIARRTGQTSDIGRLLDPIADKLLLVTIFVTASMPGYGFTPLPWWLAALAIVRDVGIIAAALAIYVATRFTGFRPTMLGKVNTVVELSLVGVFLLTRAFGLPEGLLTFGVYLTAASIAASGLHYIVHVRRLMAESSGQVGVGAH
jgi:cardiolipin synthase (CMP-forming)